ncbi:MAG TPA: ABC transporter ATP-binding protein [Firmicutes bacterium]|jgi:ABC-2 type transport system ATP-binding protein|nr:ABC transporter ATP-binding protein [Bacillota bacterium]HCF92870.1 ABC transporter ATP-binding protein [Bacillota bacterium]HCM19038.1 ABC transporter ATP-binding protein [Bacillota bacterium]HCT36907.1 ABC transporter ATP-binding protein [Bacillota bacterium]
MQLIIIRGVKCLIQVQDLTKTYNGKVLAVKGVSFEVAPGEIFGFLGPNGAGKTTTVRILSGLMDPTSGTATVAGAPIPGDRQQLHRLIGVLFENSYLYETMTGKELLQFFGDLYRQPRKLVDELLELVEMTPKANELIKKYSKGMKQRIAFARALLPQPRVLFLDEPTSGLDPASAVRLREVVRETAAQGTTVFLTTHNMDEADDLCNRVAIINEGVIVAMDSPTALKESFSDRTIAIMMQDGTNNILTLNDPDLNQKMAALIGQGVVKINTVEPSLEDVFIRMTGRGLQ